jgi:lipopolysaccharide biosynthesis protein
MPDLLDQLTYNINAGPFFEGRESFPVTPPSSFPVKYIAYYLPQFHPIPENDEAWGAKFTEWTNVTKAIPRYAGHYQPRLPGELGFYDLRDADVIRRQAELAALGGVYGFCIHNYWFEGRRLLERPLEIILENPDIDLRFCLNWANEPWTRRWDGGTGDVIAEQNHSLDDDRNYIRSIVPALSDERYIRIDGRPLLMVYRPALFPDFRATIDVWREYLVSAGLGNPYIVTPQAFDDNDPTKWGADAAAGFPPHNGGWDLPRVRHRLHLFDRKFTGQAASYDRLAQTAIGNKPDTFRLFPGVCPQWDNEARRPGYSYSFFGSTPAKYGAWLKAASDYAGQAPNPEERIVFINAWNEWGEGAYLEPDRHYGYAYLAETARALAAMGSDPGLASHGPDSESPPAYQARESRLNHLVNRSANIAEILLSGGKRGSSRLGKAP